MSESGFLSKASIALAEEMVKRGHSIAESLGYVATCQSLGITPCDQCMGCGCDACQRPTHFCGYQSVAANHDATKEETKVLCEHDWKPSRQAGWKSWCCKCDLRSKEAKHA